MPAIETFSKRKRRLQGDAKPYQVAELPQAFRVQVIHIWQSALGVFQVPSFAQSAPASNHIWKMIHDVLAREGGVFELSSKGYGPDDKCKNFLLDASTDEALDAIELTFRAIDKVARQLGEYPRELSGITQDPDDAVEELNHRFKEHNIGYQYVEGYLIELSSDYMHSQVVEPAVMLLHEHHFSGPTDEFLKAHEHYRHGRFKEAATEALKALESTIKAICDARSWSYPSNATAKPLIDVLFSNGLIPEKLQSELGALRSLLESGLPTVSNTSGRHGQGSTPVALPDYVAAYALHMAAADIVFLVEAHKAKK